MSQAATERLGKRLERLEREIRWWRCGTLLVALGLASVVLMGQASPTSRTVEAERFVLKDARGTIRAQLTVLTDGGGPVLGLADKDGRVRAFLSLLSDGAPLLALSDTEGKARVTLGFDQGVADLTFLDRAGKRRVQLAFGPDLARLVFSDQGEKVRAALGVGPDGVPTLGLFDKDGHPRAGLSLHADGEPGLVLADKDGKVIWKAP